MEVSSRVFEDDDQKCLDTARTTASDPRDCDDENLRETQQYKVAIRAVHRGNRRAKIGAVVTTVIDWTLPGSLAAYQAVRPLVIRLTCLSTRSAYRSFKFYAQLQRVCNSPYLPNLEDCGLAITSTSNGSVYKQKMSRLHKFVKLAAAIYDYESLRDKGVIFIGDSPTDIDKDRTVRLKKASHSKIKIIKMQEDSNAFAPAWALIEDGEDKELILVIQGSSCISDWITNLMCTPDDDEGTHAGMTLASEELSREVKDMVIDFFKNHRNYKFIVTGHSLGGGVASLLTIDWIENLCPKEYHDRIHCYSFASPCVIPDTIAGTYSAYITSVIFGKDIVPRLSFGTARDLLVVMQALAIHEKKKSEKYNVDEILADETSSSDSSPITDEKELKMLPSRRSTLDSIAVLSEYEIDTSAETDISFVGLSTKERQEELEKIAMSMIAKRIDLGGASFNQIATILDRRAKDLDRRRETLKKKTADDKKPSWGLRFLWKLAKLCWGGYRSTYEFLDASVAQENRILRNCLDELEDLVSLTADRCLVPAGEVFLVVPKLHFLEAENTNTYVFNKGECVMFLMDRQKISALCQRPIWSVSAIKQHSIGCYLQAFAPECLKEWPLESARIAIPPSKIRKQSAKVNKKMAKIDEEIKKKEKPKNVK